MIHDEMVYGKQSLVNKMWGDDWQKFATIRAYYAFMWAYPGKKLLFMGGEFAQRNEWNHDTQLDWALLDTKIENRHFGVQLLIKNLNAIYKKYPPLYELDYNPDGFKWLIVDDCNNSIYAFKRIDKKGLHIIVVCNFTYNVHYGYRLGIDDEGDYQELINTDLQRYGGSHVSNPKRIRSEKQESDSKPYCLLLTIPPLATLYLIKT